jgi:hypothetical protein
MIIVIGIKTQSYLVSCCSQDKEAFSSPGWTDPDTDPAYNRQLHTNWSLVMTYAALTPIVYCS